MELLVDLLRVRQWVKNFFIIFPLIFSGHFNEFVPWLNCWTVLAGFCFISSGMYIVNDIIDLNEDRMHPKKSQRPLAAAQISTPKATVIVGLVLVLGCSLCWLEGREVFILALSYVLLHVLYNLRTKHVVILDILTVAFGFQIRIWAGSAAVHILPSLWLQMCVFVLALFLGFTKRRYEMVALKSDASSHRAVLSHYTSYLLDQIIIICSTLSIVFYGLFTISSEVVTRVGGYEMFYSTSFVIYGIFRYLYLLHVKKLGDDPSEALLSDAPMIINILLWMAFVMIVIRLSLLNA